jgi:hypothetical protein
MDRKTSISLHDLFERIGADAAAIASGGRRVTNGPSPAYQNSEDN